jgi:hypothetical protein
MAQPQRISSASMRSSTRNGGVSDSLSTSGTVARPRPRPVGSVSLTVPLGPVADPALGAHDVLVAAAAEACVPTSWSGSTTTCTMPATSRTSRNTTPPWSRRLSTHPHTTTSRSMSVLRRSPARSVRIIGVRPLPRVVPATIPRPVGAVRPPARPRSRSKRPRPSCLITAVTRGSRVSGYAVCTGTITPMNERSP